jgi:hypothetical protein
VPRPEISAAWEQGYRTCRSGSMPVPPTPAPDPGASNSLYPYAALGQSWSGTTSAMQSDKGSLNHPR